MRYSINIKKLIARKNVRMGLLAVILLIAAFLRFHDLGTVEYLPEELWDIQAVKACYNNLNPFILQPDSLKLARMWKAELPYYFACAGNFSFEFLWKKNDPLRQLRSFSAFFGTLFILLTYFLGKVLYGRITGMISAFLLAISTWHIGYSRFAVTAFDNCPSLFFIISILLFYNGIKHNNCRHLLFAGITTGLAAASKFSYFLLIPIFFLFLFFADPTRRFLREKILAGRELFFILLLNAIMLFVLLLISTMWAGRWFDGQTASRIFMFVTAASIIYMMGFCMTILKLPVNFGEKELGGIFVGILLLALIFTFLGSPSHLKPELFRTMLKGVAHFYNADFEAKTPFSFLAALNMLFIRVSFPLNVFFIFGFFSALSRIKRRVNLFTVIILVVFLSIFSLSNVLFLHYLTPLLPLILIISVNELLRIGCLINSRSVRVLYVLFLVFSLAFQFYNIKKIMPYYHLDGYKLGYDLVGVNKKPVWVSWTGLKESIGWLEDKIPDNSRIGILYYDRTAEQFYGEKKFREGLHILTRLASKIYSKNATMKYDGIIEENDTRRFDYLIVSSILKKEWVAKRIDLDLMHVTKIAGLEVFRIYEIKF